MPDVYKRQAIPSAAEMELLACPQAKVSYSLSKGVGNGPVSYTHLRKKGILRLNNALKSALSHQQNIFEGMNIRDVYKRQVHSLGKSQAAVWQDTDQDDNLG